MVVGATTKHHLRSTRVLSETMAHRPVTVICTVFNEVGSIGATLESLQHQSRQPDEIVIVDAGSSDGTINRLTDAASEDKRIRVLVESGNRSHGRNAAIEYATYDTIACIDGGCFAHRDWLQNLVEPFGDGASWVAGFYEVDAESTVDQCVGLTLIPVPEEVDAAAFLPSARSMAMTRSAWRRAGRFPEHAEFAEDTLFDAQMLGAGFKPTFVASAIVRWKPPSGFRGLARTAFSWGRGDGAARLRGRTYARWAGITAFTALATALTWWFRPSLLILLVALVIAGLWYLTRHKYRYVEGVQKYVVLPVAMLTSILASLLGYVVGRVAGEVVGAQVE
ncbi:MAG: glycosyltransferase family 2 protein [Acidimicrobiia bacterium]|nr:MAG: glycosyltransferase family 2 protein [Acidimicrobiia bacterium]